MILEIAYLGLAIDSPSVSQDTQNFRPPTWPPHRDFPIVVDATGRVVSRYGDAKWDLREWAKKPVILDFGDGQQRNGVHSNTPVNADLLRQIVAWWLYGPGAVRTPITLRSRFYSIRRLFSLCSRHNIAASDLKRFPAVTDEFRGSLSSDARDHLLPLLHVLHEQREQLGFSLLDRKELTLLEAALQRTEARQTPYIPPRIWTYQVRRLREFLDDFHVHRNKIEACYHFCLEAYATNAGSLGEACRVGQNKRMGPFWARERCTGTRMGLSYHGPFIQTASRFGIAELLQRWTVTSPSNPLDITVRSLAKYFTMVSYVGLAYILNFSLMRSYEGRSLRADCLEIEDDERFGPLYVLCGATTKTFQDNDARWPTSPSVQSAVEAMACVARLRMICAEANPDVPTTPEEISNPYLLVRPYEPWGTCGADELREPLSIQAQIRTYQQVYDESYPCLFDLEELRITGTDLQVARLVTPTLDSKKFAVGKIWPLAWHQLRRTGAVNMQASGLVSDASLQYLLKHASRVMSLYYGQGYSRVRLNASAQSEYIRTMYEVIGKEIANLFTDRYISPHGEKRKAEILKIVSLKDNLNLSELAKAGKISWRETLLGGCTKRGPCPYGGVDNISRCGGGDGEAACADVLYDQEKASELKKLSDVIAARLVDAPADSPYRSSLMSQQIALENALYVIGTR
jgi:hypothetical protein